jgi:hypothetical protein
VVTRELYKTYSLFSKKKEKETPEGILLKTDL